MIRVSLRLSVAVTVGAGIMMIFEAYCVRARAGLPVPSQRHSVTGSHGAWVTVTVIVTH